MREGEKGEVEGAPGARGGQEAGRRGGSPGGQYGEALR